MLPKSFWMVLLVSVVLHDTTIAGSQCGPNVSQEQCLEYMTGPPGKRASLLKRLNSGINLDSIWRSDNYGEPTCKLHDIYNMIPDDCRAELLKLLHFFVTNSDY